MTCHQTDSIIREKIQASSFSSADINVYGSFQSPRLEAFLFSLLLGGNSFHFSGDNLWLFPFPMPFLSLEDPAESFCLGIPMAWLIIALNTIAFDNQKVNLHSRMKKTNKL